MKTKTLWKYRKDYYSQNGEDGIIKEIFRRLEIDKGWFVEFGAWDGKYISNTFHLLKQGWEGIDIESDPKRYKNLVETAKQFPKLHIMNKMVSTKGEDSLDNLLSKYPISREFELLSIDVDSNDYQIWDAMKNYKPKIVIVEVNSYMGPRRKHISILNAKYLSGTSFASMVDLGKKKGYTPVCHTGNIIFVRDDLVNQLNLPQKELDKPKSLFRMYWFYKKTLHLLIKFLKLK